MKKNLPDKYRKFCAEMPAAVSYSIKCGDCDFSRDGLQDDWEALAHVDKTQHKVMTVLSTKRLVKEIIAPAKIPFDEFKDFFSKTMEG